MLYKYAEIALDNKPELAYLSDYQLQKYLMHKQKDREFRNTWIAGGLGTLGGGIAGALLTKRLSKAPTLGETAANSLKGAVVGGVLGMVGDHKATPLYNNTVREREYNNLRKQRNALVDTYKDTEPNMYRMLKAYHKDTALNDIVYTSDDYNRDVQNAAADYIRSKINTKVSN